MDNEIQLISDGDGLTVIGSETDVERFLVSEGLSSKDLGLRRLKSVAGTGAVVAQAGSDIAAESACWVKLTRESAQVVKKYGLRESAKTGLSTGVVKGPKGQIRGFVEFASKPRSLLGNPAALAHAAGIMAQLAMQQTMDEITDYLATIDEKVDDVLRAQADAALSDGLHVTTVSYNHDEFGDYNFHGSWYSNNAKDHGRGWFKCYGGTCWVDPADTLTLVADGEAVLGDELVEWEAGAVFHGGGHYS